MRTGTRGRPVERNALAMGRVFVFMRRFALIGLILLSACGPAGRGGSATVSSTRAPSASSTPAVATSSPGSSCRLPVAQLAADQSQPALRPVGFVSYPGGVLTVDQSDGIRWNREADNFSTVRQPLLIGQDSEAYDWSTKRWLPTKSSLILPGGGAYVYMSTTTPVAIHLVTEADAHDRVISTGPSQAMLGAQGNVVYAAMQNQTGPDPRSLTETVYAIDEGSGTARTVSTGSVAWEVVANGYAFGTDINPADPHPLIQSPIEPGMSVAPNRLWALRLSDGVSAQWLYEPGSLVEIGGVDLNGRVITVVVNETQTRVVAVTDATTNETIYTGPGSKSSDPLGLNNYGLNGFGIADEHGFWLSTVKGILLYRTDSGFSVAYSGQASPVGACR
jgi:hypothetical protein